MKIVLQDFVALGRCGQKITIKCVNHYRVTIEHHRRNRHLNPE